MKIRTLEDMQQAELRLSMAGQGLVVSVFLIDGLLIDTGPAKMNEILIPLFDQWEMNEVILTHHHEDHTGLAHWIQENKNIPILIHELGVKDCEKKLKLPFYRKVFWGEREPFQPRSLEDTYETSNYTWDVIHTPGHADDHVALFNREKGWMFGGDLYVQSKPKSMFAFESLPTTIHSLKKILSYDFETYICSHAGIILKGRREIERKVDYLVSVQEEVLFLNNKGMPLKQIRKELFPKSHPMHYLSFFENSPKHMISSILK